MKRLIPLLALSILTAIPIGVAVAGNGSSSAEPAAKKLAPLALPSAAPPALQGSNGGYGYRSEDWLARSVGGGSKTSAQEPSSAGGGSATVTVTATVLPVRTIVVRGSRVTSIVTNTPDRASHTALYIVREGSISGADRPLTPGIWKQARQLGSHATAGIGKIAIA